MVANKVALHFQLLRRSELQTRPLADPIGIEDLDVLGDLDESAVGSCSSDKDGNTLRVAPSA